MDAPPGRNGIDGVPGDPGLPGKDGINGTPGRNGTDGHSLVIEFITSLLLVFYKL